MDRSRHILGRKRPARRQIVGDAHRGHELEVAQAVIRGIDNRVDDDVDGLQMPADDRADLRRETAS